MSDTEVMDRKVTNYEQTHPLGACYVCILHGPPPDGPTATDMQGDEVEHVGWPRAAITLVAGTGVCAEHVPHIANHMVLSAQGITELPETNAGAAGAAGPRNLP